jgi:hypothetical protein
LAQMSPKQAATTALALEAAERFDDSKAISLVRDLLRKQGMDPSQPNFNKEHFLRQVGEELTASQQPTSNGSSRTGDDDIFKQLSLEARKRAKGFAKVRQQLQQLKSKPAKPDSSLAGHSIEQASSERTPNILAKFSVSTDHHPEAGELLQDRGRISFFRHMSKADRHSICLKSIFIVFMAICACHWWENPRDRYQLMDRGVRLTVEVQECETDSYDHDNGYSSNYDRCTYQYSVNGQTFEGSVDDLIDKIDIVYLPENPTVHEDATEIPEGRSNWLIACIFHFIVQEGLFLVGAIYVVYSIIKIFVRQTSDETVADNL